MNRILTLIKSIKSQRLAFLIPAFLLSLTFIFAEPFLMQPPVRSAGTLLILQANTHGNSTNGGASGFANSAIELYNNSDVAINLSSGNYYLHIGSNISTNEGWLHVFKIEGTINARSSFLIVGNTFNHPHPRAELPAANQTFAFELSNNGFKIAIMQNQPARLAVADPQTVTGYIDMVAATSAFGIAAADISAQSRPQGPRRTSLDNRTFAQADFRGELDGSNRTPDNQLYKIWPRNAAAGAWNPMTGDPAIHPRPYPHLDCIGAQIALGASDMLANELLILQAYGSASDAAGASHSFVELYNTTENEIDLTGIVLHYAAGTSVSNANVPNTATKDAAWFKLPLSGKVPRKSSFLILGARESNVARLQIDSNSGDMNEPDFTLSNRAFKVALLRNNGCLNDIQNPFTMGGVGNAAGYIDMVGAANTYGVRDMIHGFEMAPARNSASEAVRRINLIDTDNNNTDFRSVRYNLAAGDDGVPGINDTEIELFRPKNVSYAPWDPITGVRETPSGDPNITADITSFSIPYSAVGWTNAGNWNGTIDQAAKTITFTVSLATASARHYIANMESLAPQYALSEASAVASVNGVLQWQGISRNDFRSDVIYKVGNNEYTVRFESPQSAGLPVINIDLDGGMQVGNIPHSSLNTYLTMAFSMSDPNNPINDISTLANQEIRGRGNSTWCNALEVGGWGIKRPYRVRFRQPQSMFGLPAARNWVLLAQHFDITLGAKTAYAFELGKRIGLQYTPSYNHVVLYINGQFRGVYTLTEHRQADPLEIGAPGRPKVDLQEGWMVELDRLILRDTPPHPTCVGWEYVVDAAQFNTGLPYELPIEVKSPDLPANAINTWVEQEWKDFLDLLSSSDFPDNGYRDIVDIETFVKYFMVNMIVMNGDWRAPGSVFMYRDKGGKISAGPIWDFDVSFGFNWTRIDGIHGIDANPEDGRPLSGGHPTVWNPANPTPEQQITSNRSRFFARFMDDPLFRVRWTEIWNEHFAQINSMTDFVTDQANILKKAADENYKVWRQSSGTAITPAIFDNQMIAMRNYSQTRLSHLNTFYNSSYVGAFPMRKNFADERTVQEIIMISAGQIADNFTATLDRGTANSAFEIVSGPTLRTRAEGGTEVVVSVRPKIITASQTDILRLTASQGGQNFNFGIQLNADNNINSVAELTSLTVSQGELTPAFDTETTDYTVSVPSNVSSLTIDARSAFGTISGIGSKTLSMGENTFDIIVTAANGTTTQTYTIVVTRTETEQVTSTPEIPLVSDIKLYPNPTSSLLHIEHGQMTGHVIRIYNITGSLLASYTIGDTETTIDVSHLPTGTYLLRIGNYSTRFVKE